MCTENQIREITESIAKLSKEVFGNKLRSVMLYGSYARKDYNEESDVDIMILIDIPRECLEFYSDTFCELTGELGLKYNTVITVSLRDTYTFDRFLHAVPYYQNIQREGIQIAV